MLKIGDRVRVVIIGTITETTRLADSRIRVHVESDPVDHNLHNRARVYAEDCVLIEPS